MSVLAQFKKDLEEKKDAILSMIPAGVSQEKLERVLMLAVSGDPGLLEPNLRKSLWQAIMRCAQDGLLPDKKEAVFTVVRGKNPGVLYLPMVGGVIKKMYEAGGLIDITIRVVKEGDEFSFWADDTGEHVLHKPSLAGGKNIGAWAVARTKSGGRFVEVLRGEEIDKIRQASRSQGGPWAQWPDEMAKKSVIKRMAKRMNLSPTIHTMLDRDNELYEMDRTNKSIERLKDL